MAMPWRYRTPRDLMDALHGHAPDARSQLRGWLEPVLARVFRRLGTHNGPNDHTLVTRYALHAAEAYLRTRPIERFDCLGWEAVRAAVLLHLAKQTAHPFGASGTHPAVPPALPDDAGYQSGAYFLPYDRVGNFWYGGDWYTGRLAADGSLWILVADITGHGYHAYLLASALPGVWQAAWHGDPPGEPVDVLAAMHVLLEECLPDGVYVECTLARFGPDGDVLVAPAGGSRLLLRRGEAQPPELLELRGLWLGLGRPSARGQQRIALAPGDEVLLTTDGVFEHLPEHEGVPALDALAGLPPGRTLLDGVRGLVQESLAHGPQRDDITMVQLRRGEMLTRRR